MPQPQFDRQQVRFEPLGSRQNKKHIEHDHIPANSPVPELGEPNAGLIANAAASILKARAAGRPVVLAFGAHAIKNGLAPVFIALLEGGWITHLATNGAGIIHDWEFAYQGHSSEDVQTYAERGMFGNWQETGYNLNLALNLGAWAGRGYGESVGAFIEGEGAMVPSADELRAEVQAHLATDPARAARAATLLEILTRLDVPAGRYDLPHPWKRFSVQAAAYRLGIPSTGHPMFGHDIIYNHPMNHGASLGRAAERDFLSYAASIRQLQGGVYLSVGSAVMSPMIFEKSLSISRNVAHQVGEHIDDFDICVVDLQKSHWDWRQGEPPETNPDYYLRFNKTFNRMGGRLAYLCCDNRDFFLGLLGALRG